MILTTLFDTHFHIDESTDPVEYQCKSIDAGVGGLLAVGGSLSESRLCREFAHAIDGTWFAAGVHPHQAEEASAGVDEFKRFAGDDRLVAIGEIGLDFYYEHSKRSAQIRLFEAFLSLALELELPVVVHCRDADGSERAYETASLALTDFVAAGGRFELHCFTGTPAWAETFLELGGYLGFTGIVTFPKAGNVREALDVVPLDRLLIETDAPYLAPVPYRGKTNHSEFLPAVAAKIAELKGMTLERFAEVTTRNADRFFALEASTPRSRRAT